jgi:hypothetical protein
MDRGAGIRSLISTARSFRELERLTGGGRRRWEDC